MHLFRRREVSYFINSIQLHFFHRQEVGSMGQARGAGATRARVGCEGVPPLPRLSRRHRYVSNEISNVVRIL